MYKIVFYINCYISLVVKNGCLFYVLVFDNRHDKLITIHARSGPTSGNTVPGFSILLEE